MVDFSTMEWLTTYEAMAYTGLQYREKLYWAKMRVLQAAGYLEVRYAPGEPIRISKKSIDDYFGKKTAAVG